jgi:hypothetical protein
MASFVYPSSDHRYNAAMDYTNFVNVSGIEFSGAGAAIIVLIAVWELAWKAFGLWRAAQLRQSGWFVAILLLNTIGILPILYLYVFSKKAAVQS